MSSHGLFTIFDPWSPEENSIRKSAQGDDIGDTQDDTRWKVYIYIYVARTI
jgi:hypothetical protein